MLMETMVLWPQGPLSLPRCCQFCTQEERRRTFAQRGLRSSSSTREYAHPTITLLPTTASGRQSYLVKYRIFFVLDQGSSFPSARRSRFVIIIISFHLGEFVCMLLLLLLSSH